MADKDLTDRGIANQVKGTAKELEGKVRAGIGDATDNHSEHLKGHAQELKGKVQKKFGEAQQDADKEI